MLVSVEFHKGNSDETFATNIELKIKKLLELEAVSSFLLKKRVLRFHCLTSQLKSFEIKDNSQETSALENELRMVLRLKF